MDAPYHRGSRRELEDHVFSQSLTLRVTEQAHALGFDAVGVAPADDLEQDDEAIARWLTAGAHGGMAYMAREPRRRARPREVLPGARSVIVLATNYAPAEPIVPPSSQGVGRVSCYAWGRDYHAVIENRLTQLSAFIRDAAGPGFDCRCYVDYGPVLEKAFARQAGIGFIGKNTLLITAEFGSWVFLSVILTTLELEPGQPRTSDCGTCRLCIDACPTGALTAPYQLDAQRCISYLTIENKGEIPDELKPVLNGWVFGCDICQEVCPYNARPKPTANAEFQPDRGAGPWLDLDKILTLGSDEEFRSAFKDTPLLRAKRSGLQRNAMAVMDNQRR